MNVQIKLQGTVQGVGFRPFVYRLAKELKLHGWVQNTTSGLLIEAQGDQEVLKLFRTRIQAEKPRHADIFDEEISWLPDKIYDGFRILQSDANQPNSATILSDLAVCSKCLTELFDPSNRRYRYPFLNCTQCGPRFSIIENLPYDRAATTMKIFEMCLTCRKEYDSPDNRRFHAQPNACPDCGPHLKILDKNQNILAEREDALQYTVRCIQQGQIVAVKGLGGFHLMCSAQDTEAIQRLRSKKEREEKPFALMMPDIEAIKIFCEMNDLERDLLTSYAAPILLLKRKEENSFPFIADKHPCLGVILPYTPLHHLLLKDLGEPIVATSGNRSDEPICIENQEAMKRLGSIADVFLVHNRPIKRHLDDSILRIVAQHEMILRRARGYAPLPCPTKTRPMIALGAHQKNTIALANGYNIFVSQHIGDLDTIEACDAFKQVKEDFQNLYQTSPKEIITDMHPDYYSSQAVAPGQVVCKVQHHHAHLAACMLEHDLDEEVLGVAWDGTGYGTDRTIWGGEFFRVTRANFKRIAFLPPFRLPGGDTAVREPRRSAIGLLHITFGAAWTDMSFLAPVQSFTSLERQNLQRALENRLNAPLTSSVGRLFDAVASLLDIRQTVSYEGQAAMELEYCISKVPFQIPSSPYHISTIIPDILADIEKKKNPGIIAIKFHLALVEWILEIAKKESLKKVVLSGGCFQNVYLLENAIRRLQENGFDVFWPQRFPPNDGGISLGQITVAHELLPIENTKQAPEKQ